MQIDQPVQRRHPFRGAKEFLRPWYLRNVYFRMFPDRRPAYFDRAWQYPHASLAVGGDVAVEGDVAAEGEVRRLLGAPPSGVPERTDFLFLPMSDLHFRKQRPHFLMEALAAKGHRCFFLNPHLGREFRRGSEASPRLARIGAGIFELHVRLRREPVYHHRLLFPEESETLAQAVGDLRRLSGSGKVVLVIASPVWWRAASLIRRQQGVPVIYDCHDLIRGFASTDSAIVAEEAETIGGSDGVICSSEALLEHCLKGGARSAGCTIVRNAATFHSQLPQGDDSRRGGTRYVGYVGAIEDWFDVESIRLAAQKHPDWQFRLAGRVESERVATLRQLPNVKLLGEIPAEQVVRFLMGLDVAIIPFLLNDLTRAVDPIKLYEYLGAGLPVVTSRLPETLRFAGLLHYYDQAEDFQEALASAMEDCSQESSLKRREAVASETWEARATQLIQCAEFNGQFGKRIVG